MRLRTVCSLLAGRSFNDVRHVFMKTNAYAYMGIGFILVSTLICIFPSINSASFYNSDGIAITK